MHALKQITESELAGKLAQQVESAEVQRGKVDEGRSD